MRLETLVELAFIDSSFSSLSSYRNQVSGALSGNSMQQSQSTLPPSYPQEDLGRPKVGGYNLIYNIIYMRFTAQHRHRI